VSRRLPIAAAVALVAASALLASCGSGSKTASTSRSAGASSSAATGTLTVYAAASLKPTFTELGATFTRENPGTTVNFSFAGSSDARRQSHRRRAR